MSLTRLAVRIAAVQALRGSTLAEGRVYDSSTSPLDAVLQEQPLPFLMVTTDSHERAVTGLDLSHGDDGLDLVIETAIASRVVIPAIAPGDTEAVEITIPNTDAGLEFTLDLIEAQVARALTARDTAWSRVFCALVPRIVRRTSRRGASAENGLRFAARQIVLSCDPLADPTPGPEGEVARAGSAWALFFDTLEATPELAALSPIFRQEIIGGAATWDFIRRSMGISAETVDALGLAPLVLDDAGAEIVLVEADAVDEDGGTLILTEQAADEQGV